MSFDISEYAGKPETVLYYLDSFNEHPSASDMVKPVRAAVHAVLDKLVKAKIERIVVLKARGYVSSDGHAELEIKLRTISSVP